MIKLKAGSSKPFNNYEIRGDITAIFLINEKGLKLETLIDTEDLEKIKQLDLHWHLKYVPTSKHYYACATGRIEHKKRDYFLHNVIMGYFSLDKNYKKHVVDHINHNSLDNRKTNLRLVEHHNNDKHRKPKNSNNKSGYRNVCYNKAFKKTPWQVQLQINGKNTVLGRFDDVHEAGKFAEEMRQKYYREFAGKS